MKQRLLLFAASCFVASQVLAVDAIQLNTPSAKLSYSLGVVLGRGLKAKDIEVDPDVFARGFVDGFAGGEMLMTQDQMKAVVLEFQKKESKMRLEKQQILAEQNVKAGEAFLQQNKDKPGVVVLSNGLQYKIVEQGKGEKPTANDRVEVDYTGMFIDGNVFDSAKGAVFPVKGVIVGWTQILSMMSVGSTWEVFVPSKLAYGEQGIGPIPPNATLIFKIHLVDIKKTS